MSLKCLLWKGMFYVPESSTVCTPERSVYGSIHTYVCMYTIIANVSRQNGVLCWYPVVKPFEV